MRPRKKVFLVMTDPDIEKMLNTVTSRLDETITLFAASKAVSDQCHQEVDKQLFEYVNPSQLCPLPTLRLRGSGHWQVGWSVAIPNGKNNGNDGYRYTPPILRLLLCAAVSTGRCNKLSKSIPNREFTKS
jgi:hypothetical protein